MRISVFYDHILQAAEQTGKPLTELLAGVRQAGMEAVEINLTYLLEHEETYELLNQADLGVSCIYEFYEMEKSDEKQKAEKHVEAAVKANAGRILVVPGFVSEEEAEEMQRYMNDSEQTEAFMNKNEKILHMAERIGYITEIGAKAGVTVTVEDFDDRKSPLSGKNGILWFLKQVPELRYTLDTGNFVYNNEDVLEAWESLKDKVVHVHCKDRGMEESFLKAESSENGINRGLRSVATGEGYLPIGTILERLKKSGYNGFLAIEHFDAPNQELCMKKSADYLRKAW